MPIHTSVPIKAIDQSVFHEIDEKVTGLAYDIHNEFGRYLDESLYQCELARRCRAIGYDVIHEPELRMTASLDDFVKDYFADLLINQSVIVETKAVATLVPAHTGQILNYLLLCGLHHGSLLNFRTERVQHEFVSTRLTPADRVRYELDSSEWSPLSRECELLKDHFVRCVKEWGAFPDPLLYRDALTHFLGGPASVVRNVPVYSQGEMIGSQEMRLITDDIAFAVTAATHHPDSLLEHQRRFLSHTKLKAIQWINLHHHKITFRTITHRGKTE